MTSAPLSRVWACPAATAPPPGGNHHDDPADALTRAELATPSGPGAGWRPRDHDPLAEGLLLAAFEAARLRRLAAFSADPERHLVGWRLATLIRSFGADVSLRPDGLIQPRGFGAVVPFLREEACRERDALAAWLALERDSGAPPEVLRDARPPFGAAEALHERRHWCIACGPPGPNATALWWSAPGSRAWNCEMCRESPDDDRVTIALGRRCDLAPAGCAPGAGGTHPRAEGVLTCPE